MIRSGRKAARFYNFNTLGPQRRISFLKKLLFRQLKLKLWFQFIGQNKKYPCFHASGRVRLFFQWCDGTMWPMMYILLTAQISRIFYFSFLLLRRGPPLFSFNFTSFLYSYKEACDCALVEILKKKGKNSQSAFPHFIDNKAKYLRASLNNSEEVTSGCSIEKYSWPSF